MRLFLGLLLAIIGFTLLFGFFSGDLVLRIFYNFFNVWPIIFIFIGISILSNIKGLKWMKFINYALSVVFVIYLVFVPISHKEEMFTGNFEVPVTSDYSDYNIQIDYAVINLEVRYYDKDYIDFQFNETMGKPDFEINGNRIRVENTYFFATTRNTKVILYLPRNLEYDFDLNSAIVNFLSNNESNYINDLRIDTAISNIKIEAQEFPVRLDINTNNAISNIKIYSNSQINYDLTKDAAFVKTDIDDNFIRNSLDPQLTVDIDAAFGNLSLLKGD